MSSVHATVFVLPSRIIATFIESRYATWLSMATRSGAVDGSFSPTAGHVRDARRQ